jgi:hypothetical protein
MKTIFAILVALCVSTHWAKAQTTISSPLVASVNAAQTIPSDTSYAVVELC